LFAPGATDLMSRRRRHVRALSRALLVAFLSSGLGAGCVGLAGCEWLAGIRDLPARTTEAAVEAAPPGVDAAPVDASTDVIQFLPDGGPLPVVLARRLALGSTHSCALRADGRVFCWGSGASGQLGTGAPPQRAEAHAVPGIANAVSIVAGSGHTCALDKDGKVSCWGRSDKGQLARQPGDVGTVVGVDMKGTVVTQIAAGAIHSCALLVGGKVRCWGDNGFGQLGDGSRDGGLGLVEPQLDSITAIFAGGFYTCALKTSGAMLCWGDNGFGQLGDRTRTVRPTPVTVRDLPEPPREVGLGQSTSCSVAATGGLACWGRNRSLGDMTTQGIVVPFPASPADFTSPTVVGDGGLPLLVAIAAGATHACGRTLADHAVCWGSNTRSQLAVETDGGPIAGFQNVTALQGAVKELAVGLSHSCALAPNDDVFCWGNNEVEQLGATASPPRAKPDTVKFVP